jgi:hypothetical protein
MSIWHGRGVVYGGSRWLLLQGIGSSGRGKPGGEVTGQEIDSGVPTIWDAHGGHGDGQGGMGC